jgi:hypothetical protein
LTAMKAKAKVDAKYKAKANESEIGNDEWSLPLSIVMPCCYWYIYKNRKFILSGEIYLNCDICHLSFFKLYYVVKV